MTSIAEGYGLYKGGGMTQNKPSGVNISIRPKGGYSGPTQTFGGVPHRKINGRWTPMRPQRQRRSDLRELVAGGHDQFGLPNSFEQGVSDANAANEQRYQQGLDRYGNLIGQLGGPGASFGAAGDQYAGLLERLQGGEGPYGQAGNFYADLLNRANNGGFTGEARGIYDQMLGMADSFGGTQKEQIERNRERGVASDKQHLIGSGLHNSTIQPSMARGRDQDAAFQTRAVDEDVQRLKFGVLGDKAGLSERDADRMLGLGRDFGSYLERQGDREFDASGNLGQYLERMGDRALNLSQEEIDFIERRTDLPPDAALFANLFRNAAGAVGGGTGLSGGFGFGQPHVNPNSFGFGSMPNQTSENVTDNSAGYAPSSGGRQRGVSSSSPLYRPGGHASRPSDLRELVAVPGAGGSGNAGREQLNRRNMTNEMTSLKRELSSLDDSSIRNSMAGLWQEYQIAKQEGQGDKATQFKAAYDQKQQELSDYYAKQKRLAQLVDDLNIAF